MGFGSPADIDQLAARTRGYAADVHEQTAAFRKSVQNAVWQSAAADVYRDKCAEIAAALNANARDLEEVDAALRAHAQAVRDRIEWIQGRVLALRAAAEAAVDQAQETATDAAHAVRDEAVGKYRFFASVADEATSGSIDGVVSAWRKLGNVL